jgi:hypothetical protein
VTATTDRQNGRRWPRLRKPTDRETVHLGQAYPRDPYPVLDVDVDETTPPPPGAPGPDVNADDTGRAQLPKPPPVLPEWARSAAGVRRNVRHVAPILAGWAAFALFRRGYAVRPAGWAFRGGWRLSVRLLRYAIDAETLEMQRHAARNKDGRARSYERKERHKTRQDRAIKTGAALAGVGLVAILIGSPDTPLVARAVLAAVAVTVLIANGRPTGTEDRDRSFLRPDEVQDPARSVVRSNQVVEAFDNAGFKETKTIGGVHLRPQGPKGWEVLVNLRKGDEATNAVKESGSIASHFQVPPDRVVLTTAGHAGQVRLTIFNEDPMAGPPVPHPRLATRSGPADLWSDGVLLGHDPRGTPIRAALVDVPAMLFAGRGGAGKTFLVFGIGAELAADPLWDTDCWSFKPSNDFEPLRPICGTFRYGADQRTFDAFDTYLGDLIEEVAERNTRLGKLPVDEVALAKVERHHAEDPGLGMRPRVVIVDEIQTALASPAGSAILGKLIEGGRILRSQNVVPVLCFQYVDRETIEQLDRLIGGRVCLSVAAHYDSKGALGGAHTPDLVDASKIPLTAKGVGFAAGVIEDHELGSLPAYKLRTFGIDRRQLHAHVQRQLAGCRAGQQRVNLRKRDVDDARAAEARSKLLALFEPGEQAVTCAALGVRMGLTGTSAVVAKKLAEHARQHADVEPRRDTTGRATGQRMALYVDREQLSCR